MWLLLATDVRARPTPARIADYLLVDGVVGVSDPVLPAGGVVVVSLVVFSVVVPPLLFLVSLVSVFVDVSAFLPFLDSVIFDSVVFFFVVFPFSQPECGAKSERRHDDKRE